MGRAVLLNGMNSRAPQLLLVFLMLFVFTVILLLGFLILKTQSWAVMLGPIAVMAYSIITGAGLATLLFTICLIALFLIKQFEDLKSIPRPRERLVNWVRSRERRA